MEGDYEMKAFYKGFINGIRSSAIICAIISGTMGAIYGMVRGLEYLINTHGEVVVVVCSVIVLIVLFGIFEGFWARYQYNKLAKYLTEIEANKANMDPYFYECRVNRTKRAMEAILDHDYSMIVR